MQTVQAKPWWRSKTVWANVLGFLALVLPEVMALPVLESVRAEIAVALTVINLALRFVTEKPVAGSEKPVAVDG